MTTEQVSSALDGLLVIDTSASFVGSAASGLLADFGAHVIMIEKPGGSILRSQPAWPFWGRGKSSRLLDLTTTEGRAELAELGMRADVMIDTWRPGVASRLGVSDADLRPANRGLVYASITGFGREHPWSNLRAYEPVVMAKLGGLTSFGNLTRREGPSYVSTPYCSFSAAQLALHGILAALIERETSGLGQWVEVTLAQGLLAHDPWNWLLQVLITRYDQAFAAAPPWDAERLAPNSAMMIRLMVGLSADGRWMQFSQTTDRLWAAFLRATDLEWTRKDPRLAQGPGSEDISIRAEFWDLALSAVRSKTYNEWLEVFDAEPDVWAEVFRDGSELLHHPQLVADKRTETIVDPILGPVHQPGPLAVLDATPASLLDSAPALGEERQALPRTSPGTVSAATPPQPGAKTPLEGTTVVEFGTFFAAPFGATLLAELGARVIKVEQLEGDPIRNVMPFPELGGVKVLAGKESVGVDVSTPEGHAIAMDLVRRADVVLLAFRSGVVDRLGLESARLREVNPNVVVLEAPGYGVGPPYGNRPAFAPTMGAGSGMAYRNLGGASNGEPGLELTIDNVKREAMRLSAAAMAVAQADGFSALAVATTMLLGLLARHRTGKGQSMSTSMLSTMAHVLSETMVEYEGVAPVSLADPDLFGLSPFYRLYRCRQGWIFLAAPNPRDQTAIGKVLGIELPEDADALSDMLSMAFAGKPALEWEGLLAAVDVTCAEVASKTTDATIMFGDAGRDLGFVIDAHHTLLEEYPRLAPLVRFSRSTTVVAPSPLCGVDTDAVLAELGYDDDRRTRLREAGVIT
jgi:crotonobetainyl-CoA:carnitine CoA-transferase CaiB-like acyl-CoA transferase